jgi:hypothetical protein
MDLTIIATYCLCDDLLIAMNHRQEKQAKMSDAEVMTTALVAVLYFGGNYQLARQADSPTMPHCWQVCRCSTNRITFHKC